MFKFPSTRRKEAIRSLAYPLNMTFNEKDEWSTLQYLKPFPLFKKGTSRKIYNILEAYSDDRLTEERIFDYSYTVHNGQNAQVITQTVYMVKSNILEMPNCFMRPEYFTDKIAGILGYQDIDFAEYPQFSHDYLLRSKDEEYIRLFFNDALLSFFEKEKGWRMEAVHHFLVLFRNQKRIKIDEYESFLSKCQHIALLCMDRSEELSDRLQN